MKKQDRDSKGKFGQTHGAYAVQVRQRYTDARTTEGRQLKSIMDSLVDDLGGHEKLNAGQRLLLDTLQSKLIVILQVGKYVDQQIDIIKDGQLLPVLGKSYLAYLNAVRLTLGELYKDAGKGNKLTPEQWRKTVCRED